MRSLGWCSREAPTRHRPARGRVVVLDSTRGGGRRYPAVLLERVVSADPELVRLGSLNPLARWLTWADDCLVLEEGDEP